MIQWILTYFIILFIIAMIEIILLKRPITKRTYVSVIVISILFFILYKNNVKENFHFEVTPWKKTCLSTAYPNDTPDSNFRCKTCCPYGYNGLNVRFDYASDKERLECGQRDCSKLKNNPNDYCDLASYNR